MNSTVLFTNVQDFLDEMKAPGGNEVEPVLRMVEVRQAIDFGSMAKVSVVATFLRRHGDVLQILKLDCYLGDEWRSPADLSLNTALEKILKDVKGELERYAAETGLQVRGGIYT